MTSLSPSSSVQIQVNENSLKGRTWACVIKWLCAVFCGIIVSLCTIDSLCTCSVRINERKHRGVADNKKMAYLVDLKTIAISM